MRSVLSRILLVSLLTVTAAFWPSAAAAQEKTDVSSASLQQAMYDVLVVIEKAGGFDPIASTAYFWNSPEIEQSLAAIPNKEEFLRAAQGIVRASQVVRMNGRPAPLVPTAAATLTGTAPYPPDYPDPSLDVDYQFLHLLGLITTNSSRCGGEGFAYYKAALAGAAVSLTAAQLACDASSCDPTGVVCISVCGATKTVQAGYLIAKAPVDSCNAWDAKLDAAQNEASWKNSISVLNDLSTHDADIKALFATQTNAASDIAAALVAHDAAIKALQSQLASALATHDAEIKALIAQITATIVANEAEIIKLLKTPEGRRPGWQKEGY